VAAHDFEGLRRITAATQESIIVDESLRTIDDAGGWSKCAPANAFNIRVSKCGGLLTSRRIGQIATDAGLDCVVGAQVGESGLLSAAGRHLAANLASVRYVEGSAGRLLLKEDLTRKTSCPVAGVEPVHSPRPDWESPSSRRRSKSTGRCVARWRQQAYRWELESEK